MGGAQCPPHIGSISCARSEGRTDALALLPLQCIVYSVQTGCAHGALPKRTEHQEIPACWVKMLGSKTSKPSTNKQKSEQKQTNEKPQRMWRRTLGDGTPEWRQLEEVPARGQLSVSQPRSHIFEITFLNYSPSLVFGQQDSEVVSKFSHNLIWTWHIFARGVQKAWSKNKTVLPHSPILSPSQRKHWK